jgi:hypothetical protein
MPRSAGVIVIVPVRHARSLRLSRSSSLLARRSCGRAMEVVARCARRPNGQLRRLAVRRRARARRLPVADAHDGQAHHRPARSLARGIREHRSSPRLSVPFVNSAAISVPANTEESNGMAPVASETCSVWPGSVAGLGRERHQPVAVHVAAPIDVLEPAVMMGSAADQHRRGISAVDVAAVGKALKETPRIWPETIRSPRRSRQLRPQGRSPVGR